MTHQKGLTGGVGLSLRSFQVNLSRSVALAILAAGLMLGFSNLRAAPLNLQFPPSHYPDLTVYNVGYTYTHDGTSGTFTFSASGITGDMLYPQGGQYWASIPNVDYSLTANFDSTGILTGGTILITGDPAQYSTDGLCPGVNCPWDGGVLLQSNELNQFGFSGIDDSGTFEFLTGSFTGDMGQWGATTSAGIVASTFNMTGDVFVGDWDPTLENKMPTGTAGDPYTFTGTATIDTFVPLPAAALMFGSALFGLFGMARRKVSDV